MSKFFCILICVILVLIIAFSIFFKATPVGKSMWNTWFSDVQKADDDTNYATLKKVEDTCRAMMASYDADKLTYEQYKDSDDSEKQSWAEQAKMRANKTAASYNNYILKNNYVWNGNVPADISTSLEYIEGN